MRLSKRRKRKEGEASETAEEREEGGGGGERRVTKPDPEGVSKRGRRSVAKVANSVSGNGEAVRAAGER